MRTAAEEHRLAEPTAGVGSMRSLAQALFGRQTPRKRLNEARRAYRSSLSGLMCIRQARRRKPADPRNSSSFRIGDLLALW